MDRCLAAAGNPYTQLEWSEVRRKPSHCIPVGELGRQPSPDVARCHRPQVTRVFAEGDHVASEQYRSDLGGALASQEQVHKIGQGLNKRQHRLTTTNQVQHLPRSEAIGAACGANREALSHSLPDYRHTSCIHSLIGRFYANEYSCTMTSQLSCW